MTPRAPAAKDDTPNVFTIPSGVAFVDALAEGIGTRTDEGPEALARVTVLLPTRRARRSLAEAFLRQSGGRPMLLPRMMALGDLDEDEVLFAGDFGGGPGIADSGAEAGAFDIPPALSGLRRRLLLARLIMAGPEKPGPEQAANLAHELARLLDQVHTERLSFDRLDGLVPADYAEHWQETLDFLRVLTENWPKVLDEEGALDAAERRNRVFDALAQGWRGNPPDDPVIAAGSTGSIPATADLLAVVARLPAGAVVLPGLDLEATDEAWRALAADHEQHPQFGMARLLDALGVARADVRPWPTAKGGKGGKAAKPSSRARLAYRALTPAGAAEPRRMAKKDVEAALLDIERIDCPGPAEEAAVIALVMRGALETPGRTAALVTPDRALARRVAAALDRWALDVDDSAGVPLDRTKPGAFLRLVARMAADGLAPVALLAALKHPLAAGGMARGRFRALVRALETAALRGPRPAPGIEGLRAAVAGAEEVPGRDRRGIGALLDTVEVAVGPLLGALGPTPVPLADVLRAHVAAAEALAAADDGAGARNLWAGDAGEQAAGFVAELLASAEAGLTVTAADYPALLDALMAGVAVRPRHGRHPRLHIWGLLEARLQQADVMILGGLNEGTWPPEAKASPWMSRPMLRAFGLASPERRLGLTAHDFAQAFAAPHVVLTRAERVDGTPQVPARWLLRLDNLLERLGRKGALKAREPWLGWAAGLDDPDDHAPVAPPRPTPPVKARPRKLSVTRIEHWIRDPYAIYARYVLGLEPLDPLDAEPGAAERGILVHDILDRFLQEFRDALPDDAEKKLIEIGRQVFDDRAVPPGVRAFWWPRFERIAEWFTAYERDRREQGFRTVAAEAKGEMTLAGPAGDFRLTARADRIDRRADAGLVIMDYKTGQAPSAAQVEVGLAPQLPLEAAIAEAGGFAGVAAEKVAALVYLRLVGGREVGKERILKLDVAATTADALAGLERLIARYDDPKMPYLAQPRPMLLERAGDYDHLARVLEWRGRGDDA